MDPGFEGKVLSLAAGDMGIPPLALNLHMI